MEEGNVVLTSRKRAKTKKLFVDQDTTRNYGQQLNAVKIVTTTQQLVVENSNPHAETKMSNAPNTTSLLTHKLHVMVTSAPTILPNAVFQLMQPVTTKALFADQTTTLMVTREKSVLTVVA
jgi:hypothetical protein